MYALVFDAIDITYITTPLYITADVLEIVTCHVTLNNDDLETGKKG